MSDFTNNYSNEISKKIFKINTRSEIEYTKIIAPSEKVGVEQLRKSLFGFAELMGEAECENRVTMRHSMQKI